MVLSGRVMMSNRFRHAVHARSTLELMGSGPRDHSAQVLASPALLLFLRPRRLGFRLRGGLALLAASLTGAEKPEHPVPQGWARRLRSSQSAIPATRGLDERSTSP